MKLRYYIALWAAKLSILALKITGHKGTNFPGIVAYKICPDFLKMQKMPEKIIGITGTNGKTTITNLIIDVLKADGKTVLNNSFGSNIITGIIATFVYGTTAGGRCKYDTAVLEIDERSSRLLFPAITPDILLVNNLTRDSIMRNGHPEYISRILTKYIPKETKLVINGDDLISCGVSPENERVYFGIDSMETDVKECVNLINDMQICPKCNSLLKYDALRYHHIGKAYCPSCGFRSPECKYNGSDVDLEELTMKVTCDGTPVDFRLIHNSVFNVYNVVAMVAVLSEFGYEPAKIAELMKQVSLVETRFNVTEIGEYRVIKQMSKEKNALASSRVFDYLSTQPGRKEIILMMNCLGDSKHWSENICWMYDCDFEFLNNDDIVNLVCTGPRAKDYYFRLKIAGVPDNRISLVENETEAPHALKLDKPADVYVLYGTDSLWLAEKVLPLVEAEVRERGIR